MADNTTPDLSLQDSIQLLLQQVPVQVRDFILNELPHKTDELMVRFQLHVDQGGILERELLLMLLGQEQPVEFVTNLEEAGIDSDVAGELTKAINEEIFMKLREREDSAPARPIPPAPKSAAPVSAPIIATPIAPVRVQPPTPAPVAAPVVSAPVIPTRVVPPTPAVSIPMPTPRTMMDDMKEAKEHPENIHAPEPIAPYVPTPTPPVVQMPQQPVAPVPQPVVTPMPAPRPAPQSTNKEALHDILKSYGVDPYREPAE